MSTIVVQITDLTASEELQNLRSLEVLEYVNTPEALVVLKTLAQGGHPRPA
jgi:hypothetical protein